MVSVSDLCDTYLAEVQAGRIMTRGGRPKKPSTINTDVSRINAHIKPLLGTMNVETVTSEDVEELLHRVANGETAARSKTVKLRGLSNVRGGRGAATRTVGLLGAIFSYSVRKRLRSDNPVRGVLRFADGRKDRRLSEAEYEQFGRGLALAEGHVWPAAVSASRFVLLTGWRRGEALGLKWSEVDFERRTAILDETKTGRSLRPLSSAACAVVAAAPRTGEYVFAATRGTGLMSGFPKWFGTITRLGGLADDVTPHVLRHSYASLAADLGFSEPTIAALIGHKGQSITSRYVHSADAVLLAAADSIAECILARLQPKA
jgi:integrase